MCSVCVCVVCVCVCVCVCVGTRVCVCVCVLRVCVVKSEGDRGQERACGAWCARVGQAGACGACRETCGVCALCLCPAQPTDSQKESNILKEKHAPPAERVCFA